MLMKNSEIYNYAQALIEAFQDNTQRLPVKINFYLQKNKKTLLDLSQDIEQSRMEIAQNYGVLTEDRTAYKRHMLSCGRGRRCDRKYHGTFHCRQILRAQPYLYIRHRGAQKSVYFLCRLYDKKHRA